MIGLHGGFFKGGIGLGDVPAGFYVGLATGICEGGKDTGDGSPCTPFTGSGGISTQEIAGYNASLTLPGAMPITPANYLQIMQDNADAANILSAGGTTIPAAGVSSSPVPPGVTPATPTIQFNAVPTVVRQVYSQPIAQSISSPGPNVNASQNLQISIVDNITGVSGVLVEGNPYTLIITGALPNSPVGYSTGSYSSVMGMTDSNGTYTLPGTTPNNPGGTTQTWSVGGQSVNLGFTIIAPPQSSNTTTNSNTAGAASGVNDSGASTAGTSNPGGTVAANIDTTTAAAVGGSTDILSELENDTVFGIPLLYLGIGLIGLVMLTSHKGR